MSLVDIRSSNSRNNDESFCGESPEVEGPRGPIIVWGPQIRDVGYRVKDRPVQFTVSTTFRSKCNRLRRNNTSEQAKNNKGSVVGRKRARDLKDPSQNQTNGEEGFATIIFADWHQNYWTEAESNQVDGLGYASGYFADSELLGYVGVGGRIDCINMNKLF